MEAFVYLDHAATTPLDKKILELMAPYFSEIYGNADSPHSLGRKAMNAVDSARDKIADLINAKPQEVYFTSGGTESDNWAVLGGARAKVKEGKNEVIISSIEHHAVLYAAKQLEKEGFKVTYLPGNEGGMVELNALQAAMTEQTGMVAIMMANNEVGSLQPVQELAKIAKEKGALFFTDAVQAAPYIRLDVKELGVDMLAFSSHKFYGPKGCGVLYIRSGVKMDRLIVGGEQERGLRGGTTNVPAVVGLAAAYAKNVATMSASNEKIQRLRETFLSEILTLNNVHINGDSENALAAVLNLRFDGVRNEDLLYKLDLEGVCIAAGSACASASVKPSHVLTAMGLQKEEANECIRLSFGKHTTEEEVRKAAEIFKEIVLNLREKF
jgi:cysteine desulfurase